MRYTHYFVFTLVAWKSIKGGSVTRAAERSASTLIYTTNTAKVEAICRQAKRAGPQQAL